MAVHSGRESEQTDGGIGGPVTVANIADYFEIIDNGTGQGAFGAGNPFTEGERLAGPGFGVAWAVPEPGSMILAGLASAACGWYGRRRLRKDRNPAHSDHTKPPSYFPIEPSIVLPHLPLRRRAAL